jgi:transcriptional regulator with XRE-family HTH domain
MKKTPQTMTQQLIDAARIISDAIRCLEPIARTGRLSEGGEQRGNSADVADVLFRLKSLSSALAACEQEQASKAGEKTFVEKVAAENPQLFERERVLMVATELICWAMQQGNVSRAELARRLDVSKSQVTQMLDGEQNMTLATVAEALRVVGYQLYIDARPSIEGMTPLEVSGSSAPSLSPAQRTEVERIVLETIIKTEQGAYGKTSSAELAKRLLSSLDPKGQRQ